MATTHRSPIFERTATLKWWAVRVGSLIASACILVILAGLVAGSIESRTLAERTVESPNGYKTNFRIHRDRENIRVSVRQIKSGTVTGWSNMLLLGTTKSLRGTEASIDLDETEERVLLRAGNKELAFDLNTNHFDFPAADSP